MNTGPFTERSNVITENIDVCSCKDMVNQFYSADDQIFKGVNEENLFNEKFLSAISEVSSLVYSVLSLKQVEENAVVFAGCGTSGRIGFLISKVFNDLLHEVNNRPFLYSIAGGDKSILTSQEAPEDDPSAGVQSLINLCRGKKRVIYVGITCGLSAPFVAGQLDHCMAHLDVFTPVLIGFNPVSMARNVQIPGWDKTVREVALKMERLCEDGKAFIINPVLGPEAITGSSRMKGGSATKVILEVIMLSAMNALAVKENSIASEITPQNIEHLLRKYERVCKNLYESEASDVMSNLISICGSSLKKGGHVRYLASGWSGTWALIDATECPPTYGATVNDIRGFVVGGYDFLGIEDFGVENEFFKLNICDFFDHYKERNLENDTVVAFLQSAEDPLLIELRENGDILRNMTENGNVVAVLLDQPGKPMIDIKALDRSFNGILRASLPPIGGDFSEWDPKCRSALVESLYSCCLKWILNATSTAAHVLLGKVYKNYMCDVKVSNNKLYHRAIQIVQTLCNGISYGKARECLLKSIYDTDCVTPVIEAASVSDHLKTASPKDKVVPIAIVLASLDCSVDDAKRMLKKHPIVRNALLEVANR